jgi:TPR repeat protein
VTGSNELKDTIDAANAGDVLAQCVIAGHYYAGKTLPRSLPDAEKWWRIAAQNGNAAAQYCLGFNCYGQIGVDEAVEWITKSANNGYYRAQTFLGCMHLTGWKIVKRDRIIALKWLMLGAERKSAFLAKVFYALVEICSTRAAVRASKLLAEEWRQSHLSSTRD